MTFEIKNWHMWILLLLISILSLSVCLLVNNQPKKTEQVPCYDRFDHEIEQLTCEKKTFVNPLNQLLLDLFGFIFAFNSIFVLGGIGYLGVSGRWNDKFMVIG